MTTYVAAIISSAVFAWIGHRIGYAAGHFDGRAQGRGEGYAKGHGDGEAAGYKAGWVDAPAGPVRAMDYSGEDAVN